MAGDDFVSPKMPPISPLTDFFRSLLGGDWECRGKPTANSLLVHLSCGLQSLWIGIWRGFCYAIEATENPEVLLTPCRGNIKMHRTGGPGLANASQVPANTGQSEGHPSRKRADGEATHGIASMMLKRSSLSLAWHSVAWGGNALVKTRHLHRKVHTGTMVDAW